MNVCKTCRREDVSEINGLLIRDVPLRTIAKQYGIPSHVNLKRHKEGCIPSLFAEAREQKRAGLLKDVDELKAEILEVKNDFCDNGTVRVQLIARRKDAIELEAKLTGAFIQDQRNDKDVNKVVDAVIAKLKSSGYDDEKIAAFTKANFPELATEPVS